MGGSEDASGTVIDGSITEWREYCIEELADSVKRKVIRIHYEGYEVPTDPPEKSEKKSKKKKKGATKEIIDEKNEKKVL